MSASKSFGLYNNGFAEFPMDVLATNPDGTVELGTRDAEGKPMLQVGKCPVSSVSKVGHVVLGAKLKDEDEGDEKPKAGKK